MKGELKTTFIFSTHDQKIVGEAEIVFTLGDGKLRDQEVKGGTKNGQTL
jgi:putative ABC transport system ATP-binding protein